MCNENKGEAMPGHAQLSAAATGIVSVLHINQQFSSSELQHMQAALILQEVPPIS